MAGGVVVFVATLDAVAQANGDLTIGLEMDLRRPLDHLNSDQLNLPFAIIATDTDGTDVDPGLFQLEIDDGQNPILNESTSVALDEDSLDGPTLNLCSGNGGCGRGPVTGLSHWGLPQALRNPVSPVAANRCNTSSAPMARR